MNLVCEYESGDCRWITTNDYISNCEAYIRDRTPCNVAVSITLLLLQNNPGWYQPCFPVASFKRIISKRKKARPLIVSRPGLFACLRL